MAKDKLSNANVLPENIKCPPDVLQRAISSLTQEDAGAMARDLQREIVIDRDVHALTTLLESVVLNDPVEATNAGLTDEIGSLNILEFTDL